MSVPNTSLEDFIVMSIDALSWAWKQEVDTPVSMVILLHLADCANDLDGKTYYSLSAIGNRCRCHRSTVIRQLKLLEEQGYITLTKRATVGKSGNVYRANYHLSEEARQALEKERREQVDPSQKDTGQLNGKNSPVVAGSNQSHKGTGSAEISGGGREEPVPVAESDTNPNLLTQNKRQSRA